jgi:Protein of unknown function (DUF2652)
MNMASPDRLESGFLVLADISGFTAFVTATELEHGAEVTGALLDGVMEALSPPLEIQELEGDAVFALGADAAGDASLLDVFSRTFVGFRQRQHDMAMDMSCSCRACRGVLGLSLKLIVHHGSFMRQMVRGRSRVAGPDIILAHRFLKNDVEPVTYVLFTEAAAVRMGLDLRASGVRRYTGRYAHFDDVDCFVVSLDRAATDEALLGLRSLHGDLTLGADPGAQHNLREVVAA